MSDAARREIGFLLREVQEGVSLSMPHSRPMPTVGPRCHELRVNDRFSSWRVVYRVDDDAVLILEVFEKKTGKTPQPVIDACRRRLACYRKEGP